jgi:hypothetical protein
MMKQPFQMLASLIVSLVFVAVSSSQADDEVAVKLRDCPEAVQQTLKREAAGGSIDEIERGEENGRVMYEAEVEISDKDFELQVLADGTLLKKVLEEEDADADDEREGEGDDEGNDPDEKETEVKLQDCPEPVQATLKREATGGSIEKIQREREDGREVYEAEIEIGMHEYQAAVLADGTLLKKMLDDDDDDDDDKKDDDGR